MSGRIFTKYARTARKRTIGALVFLRLSENLEANLDNNLLWATLPHETTEKGRISQENGESRFCTTWRLESQWGVVDSHSAAVCCCSRPMVGLFYKAVAVLADEDRIGGSAIRIAYAQFKLSTARVCVWSVYDGSQAQAYFPSSHRQAYDSAYLFQPCGDQAYSRIRVLFG